MDKRIIIVGTKVNEPSGSTFKHKGELFDAMEEVKEGNIEGALKRTKRLGESVKLFSVGYKKPDFTDTAEGKTDQGIREVSNVRDITGSADMVYGE